MYPISRLITTSLKACSASPLTMSEVGEVTFRCRPWDLDMFMEMNNGRILTLYDLGRFDLAIRTGLAKVLKTQNWGLAVAGSTIRYRKRIHLFNKVIMRTQLQGFDDKWFYIAQSMWVKQQPASSVLLRTCVTSKGRAVPTIEVRQAMGQIEWIPAIPDWVVNWEQADRGRPWPPSP